MKHQLKGISELVSTLTHLDKIKHRIRSIQYLRGLAALGVVLCHYSFGLNRHRILQSIFIFGQNGVFVFFLISGFIIVYSLDKANYRVRYFFNFLLKRSIRIDPPYYAAIALFITLFRVLSLVPSFRGQSIPVIPGQLAAHLFYVVPFTKYPFYDHIYWTLCVEFQFYLIIGLLYFLWDSLLYRHIFLVIFSLTSLIPLQNGYYIVFHYAAIFAAGISLISIYRQMRWRITILPALFFIMAGWQFGWLIFLLLLVTALVLLYFKTDNGILAFLGNISYSLYLTHTMVALVFMGLLKRLHIDVEPYQLLWLIAELFIAVIVAYLFFVVVERPSLRLSKRIFYKRG